MTHLKLETSALPIELVWRRYWKMADDTLERPEKMTIPNREYRLPDSPKPYGAPYFPRDSSLLLSLFR